MHPARSVIFFTTASGAGYGMMIWLAVLALSGEFSTSLASGIVIFGSALGLIVGGLLSSTFHLGRPERAWRALSQWRSSWLSREGLAAVIAFVPLGLFALTWVFELTTPPVSAAIGLAGAAVSLVVIYCTAMIYASLRPIPAWHNRWTVAGYMVIGPMNGAVLLTLLLLFFGQSKPAIISGSIAIVLLLAGLCVKLLYWRHIRTADAVSTIGSATGLGHLGRVDMTMSPHDSDNYLLREMGFRIARKHGEKLRRIAIALGFAVPILFIAAALSFSGGAIALALAFVAALACQIGVTAERWLFFAEAKHAVTLYYGEQAV